MGAKAKALLEEGGGGGVSVDSSPGSSPASTPDEERCLTGQAATPSHPDKVKQRWPAVLWSLTPCCMALISIVQVSIWLHGDRSTSRLLRFDPALRAQAWRAGSYMLVHRDGTHLALNVLLQLLLAAPLQREQGGARSSAVYAAGGVAGALGAALVQPQPLVGASAGVYALLISHLAHLFLNISTLKYRKYRLFSVCVLAASDIIFCCVHTRAAARPPISIGAHGAGGAAGALLGLVAYRGDPRRLARFCAATLAILLYTSAALALALLPDTYFVTVS